MRNLGAVEAANVIRNDVFNVPGIDPAEQHHIRFVQSVCSQLGLDHSPENMHRVAVSLHKHDIGMHRGHEYPKYATRGYDGAQKIVDDEVEERTWAEEPRPEPVAAPGPVIQDPVQGTDHVDLTKQVPHAPETMEHPAGRAPDEQTNDTASQAPEVLGQAHGPDEDVHFESEDEVHTETIKEAPTPVAKPPRKRPGM